MRFWFGEKWWHEDQYRDVLRGNPTLDEIDRAMARVAEVFDEEWSSDFHGHPAALWLLSKGTGPLGFLYGLGADLLEMDGTLRIRAVVHGLKQPSDFPGVRFELGMAALLKRSGFAVEFRPPSPGGKAADLAVTKGSEEVFIELKRLDETKIQAAVQYLTEHIMFTTSDIMSERFADANAPKCAIDLSPDVLGLLSGDPELDAIVTSTYNNIIREELLRHRGKSLPVAFSIPSVANVRIGAAQDQYSGIGHPMLPPEIELKRIMRGCLREAIDQLSGFSPGIIVIQTGALLNPSIATSVIASWLSRPDMDLSYISAIVFLPAIPPSGGKVWLFPAFAVLNPKARYSASDLQSYICLREAFAIYE
jgi:hypothetical protein